MSRAKGTNARRALVTGGAGFIGSHLVDALVARGDRVLAIDDLSRGTRENLSGAMERGAQLEPADIRDAGAMRRLLREWRPDVVFHLAAQVDVTRSIVDPELDAEINHAGTVKVLEAARAAGVGRFVFASTGGALYGDARTLPTPESAPLAPLSPYGANKLAAEGEVRRFHRDSMSTVSLRLANVYGPRQDASGEGGVVAIFCRRLLDGEPLVIYGDGSSTRDYVYVGDVVAAMLAAADDAAHEPMNVGCGAETSVVELARALAETAGGPEDPPMEFAAARAGEVARSCLDTRRARETLGFQPGWSLARGLRATFVSYAAQEPPEKQGPTNAVPVGVLAGAMATVAGASGAPPAPAPADPILDAAEQHVREVEDPRELERPPRVLILSADVGEGHAAAARAVAAEVSAADPCAEVEVVEGLQWLGRFSEHVIRDGYHFQLKFMPWMYGLVYDIFTKVPPVRVLGRGFLRMFWMRRMLRRVRAWDPDVVISTHPIITNVLGILRKQGRLTMPVMATITDLADHLFWAHKGCDLHLVCYEQAVERIEPVTGPGSVCRVRPLVSPQFLEPCDRAEARRRLGLPAHVPIVLVSGGGWGVGDLDGAVATALESVDGALVVVLAGRNEEAHERLNAAFGDEPRVRILGFTKQMSDLMGAADALIHSTGGVTAMEALLRRCPVVAYGAPWGHARVNARIAEGQGLGLRAETLEELDDALRSIFDGRFIAPEVPPAPPAAPLVLDPPARVAPRPRWVMRASRVATTAASALLVAGWTLNSDDAYSLVAKTLHAKPMTRVATQRPEVGLVLRVPREGIPQVQRALAARHAHASFAVRGEASRHELARMTAGGHDVLPELTQGKTLHWLKTRKILKRDARGLELPKTFYFLTPRKGFNLGEYFYGRVSGARAVDGAVRLSLPTARTIPPLRRGQVVVVTIDPREPGSMAGMAALLSRLGREGLAAVSLEDLAGLPALEA